MIVRKLDLTIEKDNTYKPGYPYTKTKDIKALPASNIVSQTSAKLGNFKT